MARWVVLVLLLVATARSCPDESLCGNPDCGTCGNACCKLEIVVAESTRETMDLLNTSIHQGGPDGAYTPQATYEGTSGFADLRPYNKTVDFIGQATHMTPAPSYFNDSVSFTIAPLPDGGCVLTAFSISLIAGAYCDSGQNFYNIMALVNFIGWSAPPKAAQVGRFCPPGNERHL
eukprot:CAMPEP_0172610650 /NCGR_PEP_ID=MMETSP1068-20121228/30430_1 /TAXON_ID=35684 /ORGANISM="Pseudopedinella elastica, Strain CCMP716" /LENGTH=175 /DNA_ID=CAMNT_0013414415 /DNA_START=25 /DNA_END=552 /DNA_ORIENTATION=+